MSNQISTSQLIRSFATTDEAKNSLGLIEMLDKTWLPTINLQEELANPKTAFKAIRAFDKSNTYICPEQPTCAGLVDMAFFCANGIESDVNVMNIEACDKPYTFSFKEDNTMAQDLPLSGTFADMSSTLVAAARKECMTMSPAIRYTFYKTDGRMCLKNAPCGSLIDDLVSSIARKQLKKFRQVVLATANAVAATVTTTGDLLERLQTGYNALADLPDNQGKEIIGYVNLAIIRRLEQLRDNNGRPLDSNINICPVTGCREFCYGGMKLKSVESEFAPIIGTTTKTTDVLFVVPKNIFTIKSETKTAEVTWDKILVNMENTIGSFQYNQAKIPTVYATSTANKITVTL